jgi:hypothetical protein
MKCQNLPPPLPPPPPVLCSGQKHGRWIQWKWQSRATDIPFYCVTCTAMENPLRYSQKKNCAASVPHLCVCERFIYSQDRSTYFPAAEQADRSWEYKCPQTHECGNWDWGRAVPFLGIFVSYFQYCVFAVWSRKRCCSIYEFLDKTMIPGKLAYTRTFSMFVMFLYQRVFGVLL